MEKNYIHYYRDLVSPRPNELNTRPLEVLGSRCLIDLRGLLRNCTSILELFFSEFDFPGVVGGLSGSKTRALARVLSRHASCQPAVGYILYDLEVAT